MGGGSSTPQDVQSANWCPRNQFGEDTTAAASSRREQVQHKNRWTSVKITEKQEATANRCQKKVHPDPALPEVRLMSISDKDLNAILGRRSRSREPTRCKTTPSSSQASKSPQSRSDDTSIVAFGAEDTGDSIFAPDLP